MGVANPHYVGFVYCSDSLAVVPHCIIKRILSNTMTFLTSDNFKTFNHTGNTLRKRDFDTILRIWLILFTKQCIWLKNFIVEKIILVLNIIIGLNDITLVSQ